LLKTFSPHHADNDSNGVNLKSGDKKDGEQFYCLSPSSMRGSQAENFIFLHQFAELGYNNDDAKRWSRLANCGWKFTPPRPLHNN
jgi:hypothetical protein